MAHFESARTGYTQASELFPLRAGQYLWHLTNITTATVIDTSSHSNSSMNIGANKIWSLIL
jgi:hypothetical protein